MFAVSRALDRGAPVLDTGVERTTWEVPLLLLLLPLLAGDTFKVPEKSFKCRKSRPPLTAHPASAARGTSNETPSKSMDRPPMAETAATGGGRSTANAAQLQKKQKQ